MYRIKTRKRIKQALTARAETFAASRDRFKRNDHPLLGTGDDVKRLYPL